MLYEEESCQNKCEYIDESPQDIYTFVLLLYVCVESLYVLCSLILHTRTHIIPDASGLVVFTLRPGSACLTLLTRVHSFLR